MGKSEASVDQEKGIISVQVDGDAGSVVQAAKLLDDAEIPTSQLSLDAPTLDEVFLRLTGDEADVDSGEVAE